MKQKAEEIQDINLILKKYWGYDSFRPMQREIIDSILAGRDTLALLPTGGGKSITYQIPALAQDGICIVVTPLIALMKDQVDRLRSLSIPAVAIYSGMSPRQIDIAFDNCVYGDTKFLFVSPERVATEIFRYRVQRMNVSMVAVDEAHCISQWGYDFRPTYLKIAEIREHTGNAPILALTASATEIVVKDIIKRLDLKDEKILKGSFSRPNLSYAVRHVSDKDGQLFKLIDNVKGSGIIYTRSREGAEKLTKLLNDRGSNATFYHGGLPHTERSLRQEEWLTGEVRIMVATNAFGMGIDKPDVRFVAHYTIPDSIEGYYQEAGRAGRDGKRSYALILHTPDEESKIRRRFDNEYPPIETIKKIYDKICSHLQIAIGDGALSSRIFNIYDFCSQERLYRGMVVNAIKILEMNDYLTLTEEMANPARIMFCVGRDDLYKVRIDHDELDHFLRVILRLYEGLFSEFRQISEVEIAHWSGYTTSKVKELLTRLWQMRLIRYVPSNQSPLICLSCDRLAINDLYISPESYKYRKEMGEARFSSMLEYTINDHKCRSQYFEEYFGVEQSKECGVCDVCLEKKRNKKVEIEKPNIEQEIIEMLLIGSVSIKDLSEKLSYPQVHIIKSINRLIEQNRVTMLPDGTLKI